MKRRMSIVAALSLVLVLASCGKETKVPEPLPMKGEDIVIDLGGEHQIMTQSKDGAQVVLKFKLSLVGHREYKEELEKWAKGEDFLNYVRDLVTLSMQKLIQEFNADELTPNTIKDAPNKHLVSEVNKELLKNTGRYGVTYIKGFLFHDLVIVRGAEPK